MQDLKYFVDIVESVHSGGASLFGLKTAQISQLLLHSHEKTSLGSAYFHLHNTTTTDSIHHWPVTALSFNLRHNLYPNLIALMTLIYPNKLHLVQSSQVIVCLPRPNSSWAYIHHGIQIFETLCPSHAPILLLLLLLLIMYFLLSLQGSSHSGKLNLRSEVEVVHGCTTCVMSCGRIWIVHSWALIILHQTVPHCFTPFTVSTVSTK